MSKRSFFVASFPIPLYSLLFNRSSLAFNPLLLPIPRLIRTLQSCPNPHFSDINRESMQTLQTPFLYQPSELPLPIIKSFHAVLIINLTHQLAKVGIVRAVVDLSEFIHGLFLEFVSDLGGGDVGELVRGLSTACASGSVSGEVDRGCASDGIIGCELLVLIVCAVVDGSKIIRSWQLTRGVSDLESSRVDPLSFYAGVGFSVRARLFCAKQWRVLVSDRRRTNGEHFWETK
ncbi:hypothetical protein KCU98_g102, partial [Aureobasidium melanogenum]